MTMSDNPSAMFDAHQIKAAFYAGFEWASICTAPVDVAWEHSRIRAEIERAALAKIGANQ